MKPVNGQIIDDASKLSLLLDTQGKNIKFEQDKSVDGDLIYFGKGTDGRTYAAQLQDKRLIISVYETPKEKEEPEKKKQSAVPKPAIKEEPTKKQSITVEEAAKKQQKQEQPAKKAAEFYYKPSYSSYKEENISKNKNTGKK